MRKQDIIRLSLSDQKMPDVSIHGLPVFAAGEVWLVGAGPGNIGLLTLHAVNALQQADIIVYDALVSEDILALAPKTAERFYAGKRGGKASWKQDDICNTLIEQARQGKRVLRLKGGDPFIFGRGGEECEALAAANINFRIIPGISAGVGGLAYAGIPVTHRAVNHAVTFVTGHLAGGDEPELLDWQAIARAAPVIVIYMGLSRIEAIADLLLCGGRADDEPVAIVTHASMPMQSVYKTTLGKIVGDSELTNLKPPSLIVIGKVVDLQAVIAQA